MSIVYSISEFCEAHRISKAFYYKLAKEGRGPVVMRVGRRRLITELAASKWRDDLERRSGAR